MGLHAWLAQVRAKRTAIRPKDMRHSAAPVFVPIGRESRRTRSADRQGCLIPARGDRVQNPTVLREVETLRHAPSAARSSSRSPGATKGCGLPGWRLDQFRAMVYDVPVCSQGGFHAAKGFAWVCCDLDDRDVCCRSTGPAAWTRTWRTRRTGTRTRYRRRYYRWDHRQPIGTAAPARSTRRCGGLVREPVSVVRSLYDDVYGARWPAVSLSLMDGCPSGTRAADGLARAADLVLIRPPAAARRPAAQVTTFSREIVNAP